MIIAGLVLCAVLVQGIVFFLSSRIPVNPEIALLEDSTISSTFEEMMTHAYTYKEQRRFDLAGEFIRLALDRAQTKNERAWAGYQMGTLLFDDYLNGGDSRLEAAALYLQAAYDECAPESEWKLESGMALLDALETMGDAEHLKEYLDAMIAQARAPEDIIQLWRRKFDFMVNSEEDWREMNKALAVAEAQPLQSTSWVELMDEMRLRFREKQLLDEDFLDADATIEVGSSPAEYKMKLFAEVRTKLEYIIKNGDAHEQKDALLRLATALASVGNYKEAQAYLLQFIESNPTENLTEALMLLSQISRALDEVTDAAQLAESLIRRFDFNEHTQKEILHVVELLEEHELYKDALKLLEGCFSLIEEADAGVGPLIARAAVLEERLGDHAKAIEYMDQLYEWGADEDFKTAFSALISLNISQSNYEAIESWTHRIMGMLPPESDVYGDALFSLFEAKYWLDRPVLEQLYVGASAIQNMPEDPRVASVQLRMARYIETMNLDDLAVSYFNRIRLLNFFQGDSVNTVFSQNLGEQAMLGKARCLKKLEDWTAADHLYRELCNRTKSPLVKSEAAVGWAELAWRFGQKREALRRYDLAHVQMLSEADQIRYALGRLRLQGDERLRDPVAVEESLSLLRGLPEGERRNATVSFFNETFDYLHTSRDERAMLRLIDLAYQSDFSEWLPIQSYVLRLYEDKFEGEKLAGLGPALREKNAVADNSLADLAQVVDSLGKLSRIVKGHQMKAIK